MVRLLLDWFPVYQIVQVDETQVELVQDLVSLTKVGRQVEN